ncbi:helix-turn-helix domain-containing protein, partial [Cupriavidus sp. CV2]
MKDRGLITMSLREVDRFKVIQATAEGLLARWRAAERLDLTARQVRRLVQRWRADGPMGLLSRQRGQPGHRQLPRMLEAQARALIQLDFNGRFAKPPRSDFDAHRTVRADEDLERIFTWRKWRKVSQSLTLQYDKRLYLLADRPEHRRLIHRYIEVAEYPDGRIELWADGATLPYTTYDRLSEIDQGAIVENKRLGHVLRVAQEMQAKRDSRRSAGAPARTNSGTPPRPHKAAPGKKPQRQLNATDLHAVL